MSLFLLLDPRWPWEDDPAADKTRSARDLFPARSVFSGHSSVGADFARKKTNDYKCL